MQNENLTPRNGGDFKSCQSVAIFQANCGLRAFLFCIDTALARAFFTNNQPLIEAFTMLLRRFLKARRLRSS
jgi:hypothetical protein